MSTRLVIHRSSTPARCEALCFARRCASTAAIQEDEQKACALRVPLQETCLLFRTIATVHETKMKRGGAESSACFSSSFHRSGVEEEKWEWTASVRPVHSALAPSSQAGPEG